MGKIESQNKQIKAWLESGKSITPMDALNLFGSFRLGARIFDLKNDYGMNIEGKTIIKNGVQHREWWLACYEYEWVLEKTREIL